jgi:hypothetical protein
MTPAGLRTLAPAVGWAAAHRVITGPAAAADLIATIDAEDGFDLAACEHSIQAKTLIIAGGRGRFYSPGLFEQTAALIPRSQLQLYPSEDTSLPPATVAPPPTSRVSSPPDPADVAARDTGAFPSRRPSHLT